MKYLLLVGVATLISAPLRAEEATPAISSAPTTVEPVQAEVVPVVVAQPSNFCGQDKMLALLWTTEVGKALRLKQQAALEQALVEAEAAQAKAPVAAPEPSELDAAPVATK